MTNKGTLNSLANKATLYPPAVDITDPSFRTA